MKATMKCKGKNCKSKGDGKNHSKECMESYEKSRTGKS
jgi:hypothetical protein